MKHLYVKGFKSILPKKLDPSELGSVFFKVMNMKTAIFEI